MCKTVFFMFSVSLDAVSKSVVLLGTSDITDSWKYYSLFQLEFLVSVSGYPGGVDSTQKQIILVVSLLLQTNYVSDSENCIL